MILNIQYGLPPSAARLSRARIWPRQRVTASAQADQPEPAGGYRAIVENLPILVCRFQPDGTLTFVNEAYCRYFGKTRAELVGGNLLLSIPEEDRPHVLAKIRALTPADPAATYEHRIVAPDGTIHWQHWTNHAIFEGDRLVECISIGEDITEHVHSDEALRRSLAELQARNEDLDAYAHTVAHDIKNPLALIISGAELLTESQAVLSVAEQQSLLRGLLHNANKMHSMVDDLLLLASIRQMDAPLQPLNMPAIVSEVQTRLADTIRARKAEIILPAQWHPALGYAPWIEEVWFNYLSNALTYGGTPPRVTLGARPQGDDKVRFWVQDNGAGIRPEEQPHLFAPFTRLTHSHPAGSGLGLSIVRRIVEKLHGQVGVESLGVPGRGSCFHFTLPAVPPPLRETTGQISI